MKRPFFSPPILLDLPRESVKSETVLMSTVPMRCEERCDGGALDADVSC